MTGGTFALRRAAVVYVALLCAVEVFARIEAEHQPPTHPPEKYHRCFHGNKECSNKESQSIQKSQSIQAAGGTLYEMQLISPSLLEYLQGLAVENVTVNVITACASAAEQKKMNSFQYNGTVCTLYTALPDAAVLPSCANVLTAVVYKGKISLNNATVPLPQVVNVTLYTINNTLTATWTTKYFYNCIQSFKVTLNNVTLTINLNDTNLITNGSVKVSGGTFKSVPVGGTVSGIIVSRTTYQLVVVSPPPCVEYTVSITALGADGQAIGVAGTGKVTTLSQSNSTATVRYDSLNLDNLTVSWHFDDCGISAYHLQITSRSSDNTSNTTLNKSNTSLTFLGYDVCSSDISTIAVSALDVNGNILNSPLFMSITGRPTSTGAIILPWEDMNACVIFSLYRKDYNTSDKIYRDAFKGEPFKYGRKAYIDLTSTFGMFGFLDLHYSPTNKTWIWGNGDVEPATSPLWYYAPTDLSKGTCVTYASKGYIKQTDCSEPNFFPCYKFY